MKTKLTIAVAVALIAFSPEIAGSRAFQEFLQEDAKRQSYEDGRRDGMSSERSRQEAYHPSPEQEQRDKQRFEWEKEDRQHQKKKQEEMETKAQDSRREAAYRESKAAHRKKVTKMRKKGGLKSHYSWQLNH